MKHVSLDEYISRVRPARAANILLWAILGFLVIFIVWAALTHIDRSVQGMGRVVPSSRLQVVSNLEGGIIKELLVKAGQMVAPGQPLIRLDRTASGAEFSSNESQFNALAARIARLEGEVAGRAPVFPPATDAAQAEQVAIERALHQSRMADLNSLLSASAARVTQARRGVAEAQAALAARQSAASARQTELNLVRPLVERGIEPRLTLIRAQNEASVAASEAAAAAAAVNRAYSQVTEAEATLARARQDWRSRAAQDLATAQAEMVALRRSLPALSSRVDRTEVRSPMAGRVNRVLVTTVGGTVAPGAPLVEIVPTEDNLVVEARIRPQDIAWVRINQNAQIAITAYNQAVYGSLKGKVIAISPDAVFDEEAKETFYIVQVATNGRLYDQAGRPLEIGPGMLADVRLLGDRRSVLNYLLTPFTRLSQSALREQ